MKPIAHKEHKYKKVMAFDIETAGSKNEFVEASFVDLESNIKVVVRSKEEFIAFINQKKLRNYYMFATNLSFDFLGVLYDKSSQWSNCSRNGITYSYTWYQNVSEDGIRKNCVHFYDTMRIVPFSVEKLGKTVGLPKLPHPKCFTKHPQTLEEWKELDEYCINDSEITYLFVKKILIPFLKKYNIPLKMTIGSMALHDFRTNHLKEPIYQETEKVREICFKGYKGGRTETYQRGLFNKGVYCFDINSLYPSVMVLPFPDPNRSHVVKKGNLKNINLYEGVSQVRVEVPETLKIPPLPYRKDGKLIFPVGTFECYYNHVELRNAMKYGVRILHIGEQLIYPRTKKFFKSFVEQHYEERKKLQKEGDPLQLMEKNVLNNLYGKWGFNYLKGTSMIPIESFDFKKHIEKASYIEFAGNHKFVCVEELNKEPPIYAFPIWASYTTSYARIKMYEYLGNPQLQNKILSTDTDSIFLKDYNNEIPTSNELGDMKLEDGYPVVSDCYFIAPKNYMTHQPKCKGVKFKDREEYINMLAGEPIRQERFIKFRTAVRSKPSDKWGLLVPNQIIHIEKQIGLEDTKRNWGQVFDPTTQQVSSPIRLDWEQEALEAETKEANACQESFLPARNFIHGIMEQPEDLVDWKARGKDISKEEYIRNEIDITILD